MKTFFAKLPVQFYYLPKNRYRVLFFLSRLFVIIFQGFQRNLLSFSSFSLGSFNLYFCCSNIYISFLISLINILFQNTYLTSLIKCNKTYRFLMLLDVIDYILFLTFQELRECKFELSIDFHDQANLLQP